jgi:hypothetical protein
MGSTRLVLTVFFTVALTAFFLWPNSRRALHQVCEEARWKLAGVPSSDEHYRRAERYYQAGDFEKAVLECEKALQLSANHVPARALYTEVQFILGQAKATPWNSPCERFITHVCMTRTQQLLVEMDAGLARAEELVAADNPEGAEKQYRKLLEFAKWLPAGCDVEQRAKIARSGLARLLSGGED